MKANPQPGSRKPVGPVESDASSQMHSSHHYNDTALYGVGREKLTHCAGGPTARKKGDLPPSCITEPPGVHLSHVTHSDDADCEVGHGGSHGGSVARCAIRCCCAVESRNYDREGQPVDCDPRSCEG